MKRHPEKIVSIVFTIVGIVLMIVGVIVFIAIRGTGDKSASGKAIITQINYSSIYIEYNVHGKRYAHSLDYYNSGMYVGEEIDIRYNPNNPEQVSVKGEEYFALIPAGIGIIFLTIGSVILIVKYKKKKSNEALVESGQRIDAEIDDVSVNYNIRMNGRCPYYITCRWENPSDGKMYLFKSKSIWYDPQPIIDDIQIETLPVYINMNNLKKYYVCIDELENKVVDLR